VELYQQTAHEIIELIARGEASAQQITEACLERIDEVEETVNSFVTVTAEHARAQAVQADEQFANGQAPSALAGIPIAIKDVMCTLPTTCGSKILENFVPPYDATVVQQCGQALLPMVGKTNMDEFAMGSSTENSAFKVTANPWNLACVPGGSSGGSAAAVAAGEALVALGSDTGGSIRQPAALCGIVGLKPTYGRVSRYGLIAYASSLDQIGPLTRDVTDCALVMNVIAGHDPQDATSADIRVPDYTEYLTESVKGLTAGVPTQLLGEGIDPQVRERVQAAIDQLQNMGLECEEVQMPHIDYSLPVYYIIAPAECSSNLARFDGVRYGYRTPTQTNDINELFANTRAEGFGPEVRLRIMLGTYTLSAGYYDAYYLKALKVRTLIKGDFDNAFAKYDVLLSPTSPTVAFPIGERADDPLAMKLADICTIPVNLAGIPAISIPCGFVDGLPVGLQIMGRAFEEGKLLQVAYTYEQATDWHRQRPSL